MAVEDRDTRFHTHSHNPLDLKLHFHLYADVCCCCRSLEQLLHTETLFVLLDLLEDTPSISRSNMLLVCVFAFALAGLLMWVCFSVSIMVNGSEVHPFYSCTPWNSHLCSLCVSVPMAHVPQLKVHRARPVDTRIALAGV